MNVFLLFFPLFSLAAGPSFPIPSNALLYEMICTTNLLVKEKKGDAWGPWRSVQRSETFPRSLWNENNQTLILDDHGSFVSLRKIEELSQNERREKVEEWTKKSGEWTLESYELSVTLDTSAGPQLRRTERREGFQPQIWDVNMHENVIEKTLSNPDSLSTGDRLVGSYHESCAD